MIRINDLVEILSLDGEAVHLWANPDQTDIRGIGCDAPAGTYVLVMGIDEVEGVYFVGYVDSAGNSPRGWVAGRFLSQSLFDAAALQFTPDECRDAWEARCIVKRTPEGIPVVLSPRQSAAYAKYMGLVNQLIKAYIGQNPA